jgi:hypothetical protein
MPGYRNSRSARAPIVLADGGMLAPDGLDRSRGIIFEIQKEVRAIIPDPKACSKAAVRQAMQFLCEEWLCDVAADYAGKCTIITAALTIIERSLLDERPAFFVTAGRRGGGKTTLLTMLIMAVTGTRPAASAWSNNEEERRKVDGELLDTCTLFPPLTIVETPFGRLASPLFDLALA